MSLVQLNTKYNTDCKKLLDYCNSLISSILSSRVSAIIKNTQINKIKNNFNAQLILLKNKLNADILSLKTTASASAPPQVVVVPANISLVVTPKQGKKALCVGINYMGSPYQLSGCIADANNIKEKLLEKYGFIDADILEITDESQLKPTKTTILNEFKNLLVNAKPNDLLLFTFSGHGSQTTDLNGDEKDHLDEMIVSIDLQSILDDNLNSMIKTYLTASNVSLIVIFDSCHSGTMLDLKYQYFDTLNNNLTTINPNYTETACNVVMLSGCLDSQTSADAYINNKSQGAMTWAFLNSLNFNPTISWKDLILNMRSLLQSSQYPQIPQLSSGKILNTEASVFTFNI